jgi:hypothetical protein
VTSGSVWLLHLLYVLAPLHRASIIHGTIGLTDSQAAVVLLVVFLFGGEFGVLSICNLVGVTLSSV